MRKSNPERWSFWSAPQRRAVRIILAAILLWWGYKLYRDNTIIPYPQTGDGARANELDDQLDPNLASVADLAALPSIGPSVARQIAAYRDRYHAEHRGPTPFTEPGDLLKVKGLGFNVMQQISPYLKFPHSKAPDVHPRLK